jgi:phage tail-like protein
MKTTAHAVLRDGSHWRGSRRGLTVSAAGDLELMRVPTPDDGKSIDVPASYPYTREVSGLALGPCDSVFVSDTAHDRILYIDAHCGTRCWLPSHGDSSLEAPGHFSAPCGLAVGARGLWVADRRHASLQLVAFPRLESSLAHRLSCAPGSIALDPHGRLLVVCNDPPRLTRILPDGQEDTTFAEQVKHSLRAPHAVAVRATGELLVSDTLANAVLLLDASGALLRTLSGPTAWLPGALATAGVRSYVADALSGRILIFEDDELQGVIESWRGPVTALALAAGGDLYVKPGLDTRYFLLNHSAGRISDGELRAGPFDAGEDEVWERAWIDADGYAPTAVGVEVALADSGNEPDAAAWRALPSPDALLSVPPAQSGRFAWIRVHLHSASLDISPVLHQVRLATAAEDYLDYLPLTYRRNDLDGFLSRWLKLVRTEFGRIDEALELLPRLADPELAPAHALEWLAQWLAFELPAVADESARRELIAGAVRLCARRGTPASIAELVELHTGIRPAIVESFRERRVWVLGLSSRLDFDTRLPPLAPMGIVIPDEDQSACCAGPIGSAVVGVSGPLAEYQSGLPLYAEDAFRFCVVTDGYRVRDPAVLDELHRIVRKEKPAHADYRVHVVSPELRVGLQARIGIDTVVGGESGTGLDEATLDLDSRLPASEVARIGSAAIDGTLTLS